MSGIQVFRLPYSGQAARFLPVSLLEKKEKGKRTKSPGIPLGFFVP